MVKDRILYLRSVGSGDNPNFVRPIPERGLIATDVITGSELFTIPATHAILSPNRQRFYAVEEDRIEVFDALTGRQRRIIGTDNSLTSALGGGHMMMRGISANERWLYRIWGVTVHPMLLQMVDLEDGHVLDPIVIDADCRSMVYTQNAGNTIYFRCEDRLKKFDFDTQQLILLEDPKHPLLVDLSPDGKRLIALASLATGEIHVYDTETWQIIHTLKYGFKARTGPNKLLISRDGARLVVAHGINKEIIRGTIPGWYGPIATHFEFFDLETWQGISAFEMEDVFPSLDITYDGTILYGTLWASPSDASALSTYVGIDPTEGTIQFQRTRPDELISQAFLVP
jgi:hypothetical protein